jgi:hypothetical protein
MISRSSLEVRPDLAVAVGVVAERDDVDAAANSSSPFASALIPMPHARSRR